MKKRHINKKFIKKHLRFNKSKKAYKYKSKNIFLLILKLRRILIFLIVIIIVLFFIWFYNKRSNSKLIVSMTSHPPRINYAHESIETILSQTLKPDKFILWLAESDFPEKEKNLPETLLLLEKKGLTIKYYKKNLKQYLKLIPTLKYYPNSIIITVDDDIIYRKDMIEKLYKNYLKYPKDIQAHRITKFEYIKEKFITIGGGAHYYNNSSFLNKLTGVGGVLYPPNCFYKDILNDNLFMSLAPTNDDQWFWVQAILNGVRVRVIENPDFELHYVKNTQKTGLVNKNDYGPHLFWKDFKRLISYYSELKTILINEYNSYVNKNLIKI